MRQPFVFALALLLVTVGALAFRLPRLADRPMHADEAVQAARFRQLWQDGRYRYDPHEFHGPTLAYATLAAVWIEAPKSFAETTETSYRIVPVVFGVGLVLLLGLLGDGIGRPAAGCAGLLTAISPAMVFFSRYYIHETLFVFFTLAAIAAGWRYARGGRLVWCLIAGGCLGLVQATKETSVIVFFAMGMGLLLVWLSMGARRQDRSTHLAKHGGRSKLAGKRPGRRPAIAWHLPLGLAMAVLVAVSLLSSFFTNLRGPIDGVLTYASWLKRAGGASPHVYPFYHYLHMLAWWQVAEGPVWSELLILVLAILGFVVAVFPEDARLLPDANVPLVRWIGFYSVVLTAAYACIPYKTPWCLLGFLHGMILLAGVGAVALIRAVPLVPIKAVVAVALLGAAGQLGWQSYRTSFVAAADPQNPYVYAHTLPDIERLAADVEQLAEAAPEGHRVLIKVIWHDGYYWPLPWYLRRFERVGYWTHVPGDPAAPLVICSPQLDAALTEHLGETHLMTGYYGVRPNLLAELWVREDLWMAHLKRLGRL